MQPNTATFITVAKAASLTRLEPYDVEALAAQGEFDTWENARGELYVSLASVDSFRFRTQQYRHKTADMAELFGCAERQIHKYAVQYGLGIQHPGNAGRRFNDEDVRALREHLQPKVEDVPA